MIDILTKLYPSTPVAKKNVLNKVRYYSFARFFVRRLAGYLLPTYFKIANKITRKHRVEKNNGNNLIVSLTSFPARIDKVWLVIESILRQKHKPDKVILWLSKEQFSDINTLPPQLIKQQERGLEIQIIEHDLRSYKKYFYTLRDYPDSDWVIIDDDVIYPSDLISNLISYHQRYPQAIIFNRGRRLKYKENKLMPYSKWTPLEYETDLEKYVLPTGVGGVYYPKKSLHKDALNSEAFMTYCPLADDVWLYAMARRQNADYIKTGESRIFLPVINKNDIKLSTENVMNEKNDKQINSVREYLISLNDNVF